MSGTAHGGSLEMGREAAARGEWQRSYELLAQADASAPLDAADLALLADMAYAAGRLDVTIGTWERAYAAATRTGDAAAAAGAALRVAMHLLFDTGLMAPVRAWAGRAEHLLEGRSATQGHAWLAVVRSYERLLSGDFKSAGKWARQAVAVGTRWDPAAATIGRVAEARSLILGGDALQGLELLNEAALATISGELDPLWTGVVYCEVVCAFQALAQYDLAEEWTSAMEGWCHGQPVGSIHGRCRVHRAEILRLRGSCEEAERQALMACEELRPWLRRELGWPLTELGRIRLRRGDIQGAEAALCAAHEAGWDPQPGLALVQLAKGDGALAVQSIRDALAHPMNVPSKELPPSTDLRRAPLLEAQVEIEIAAGDLDKARAASEECARIAATFESKALSAGAVIAASQVWLAEGDVAGARRGFEAAVRLWSDIGAPYETALARMGLGHAHRAAGDEQFALLEFAAARAVFQRMGAIRQAAAAAGAGGQQRPAPATPARTASENVFRREGDYWTIAFEGRTVLMRDLKGLRYVARLLADPVHVVHVLDLVAAERMTPPEPRHDVDRESGWSPGLDADVFLDPKAKEAYRRRLAEIEEDIEEASAAGDEERSAQAGAERDFLIRELARAVGLGGRNRPAGSVSERARASVTRAIRQAVTRVREHHPGLGQHFDRTIRTGTYCAYLPDPRVPEVWKV